MIKVNDILRNGLQFDVLKKISSKTAMEGNRSLNSFLPATAYRLEE